jgi:hypothetical protein
VPPVAGPETFQVGMCSSDVGLARWHGTGDGVLENRGGSDRSQIASTKGLTEYSFPTKRLSSDLLDSKASWIEPFDVWGRNTSR